MRFIAGFRASALAGSMLGAAFAVSAFSSSAQAQALGFGGGPAFSGPVAGVGVGAYGGTGVPTSGPTGPSAFFGGGREPFAPVIGFLGGGWGGGYGGGYGGYGGGSGEPGVNTSISNYNYTYNDYRRRDGGHYGGGGVFYADDGYSRMYANRPSDGGYDDYGYRPAARTGYASVTHYRPAQHIFYLPTTTHRAARKRVRYETQY